MGANFGCSDRMPVVPVAVIDKSAVVAAPLCCVTTSDGAPVPDSIEATYALYKGRLADFKAMRVCAEH